MAFLTKVELAGVFNIDVEAVEAWVAAGLPSDGGRFDDSVVERWLLRTGRAGRGGGGIRELVFDTRAEVARFFDVDTRTVAEWLTDPEFPGQAGDPGKRNGVFPVKRIQEWKRRRDQTSQPNQHTVAADDHRQELARIKLEQAKINFQKQQGLAVDLGLVIQTVQAAHNVARQELRNIPPAVKRALPSDLDPRLVAQVMEDVEKIVRRSCLSIADLLAKGFDGLD